MLVCDTTFLKGDITVSIAQVDRYGEQYTFGKVKNRIPHVWWQFGYYVYRIKNLREHFYFEDDLDYEYLDQNKKPLPKSTVVWITKEIKQ